MHLSTACDSGNSGSNETKPLTIISTDPSPNAVNVAVNSIISVTFSEAVDPSTIDIDSFIISSGAYADGTVSISSDNKTAIFTPAADLSYNSEYIVTLKSTISGLSGNSIEDDYDYIFTTGTGADLIRPEVSVNPGNDAAGISVAGDIILTFSKAMNSSTINGANIKLLKGNAEVAIGISYNADTYTAVINPADELEYSTVYTVKVYNGAADVSGIALAADFTSAFNTETYTAPAEDTAKLVFVGDINLGALVRDSVEKNGGGDYSFPFAPVGSYLSNFDLAVGNLESIISDKGSAIKIVTGVAFRAEPAALSGLISAGFDIVNVANNHAGDYGEEGMVDSFRRLKASGIDYIGGGDDYAAAHKPVIKEIKGMKIALLGYTNVQMYMDSWYAGQVPVSRWIATDSRPGVAWAHDTRFKTFGDIASMAADIKAARAVSDVVVIMVHFGMEYTSEPTQEQRDLAHAAIDAGASMVIGHHPHVCQPVEEYNGGFIAYSLGNFVFDQTAAGTTTGMVVEASFVKGKMTGVHTRTSRINQYCQVSLVE